MSIDVRADTTPNPNAMKFTATKKLFDNRVIASKGDDVDHALAQQLLKLDGVDNIFGYGDFVTVNKTMDADWDELVAKIEEVFNSAS
ncbi:NifU N-terminal domain-containing protein [Tuberibacillus sp. Marseille-P3662]|uniref:NifU N-terminal domain-containing protein n=1 Tax=Tuberibacillus sp. Marseille-P3662 TaxID=1965358 RepID=UPI000A1CAFA6|nr:NifU N-terminal domain-containing protein [Tuberibacillus sp. Marseille-P3662]